MKRITHLLVIALGGLIGVLIASFVPDVGAQTSYDVHNVPVMRLSAGITASQVHAIKLNAPRRNGVKVSFPTISGGILELASAANTELIHYQTGSVNSSTLEVTLFGVTRGYKWNDAADATTFSSGESGRAWPKGTRVSLVNDMRLFNLSCYRDRANTFTGSGQIAGTMTRQALLDLNSVTTAQRNAFTFVNDGNMIYNTTTGTAQYRAGGAWYSFGSGANLNNATTSAAGKAQLSTLAFNLSGSTVDNSTSAPLVPQTQHLTMSGGTAGEIAILSTSGYLSFSIGGTNSGALVDSGVLIGGDDKMTGIKPGTRGNIIWDNGTNWVASGSFAGVRQDANDKDDVSSTHQQTVWTAIDGNLQESITTQIGEVYLFILMGGAEEGSDVADTALYIDIAVGGGKVGAIDGGVANEGIIEMDITTDVKPVSLVYTHVMQTGATLTVQPVHRISDAAKQVTFRDMTFQVLKLSP